MAYTTIDDPSVYFQTLLYTGNSSTRSVTNDGNSDLQPDWVWTKCRSNASDNFVFDSNRGVHKRLFTNTTAAEVNNTNALTAFNSDGFSMGNVGGMNFNSQTYVAWQWKCNAGTTSTNSDGTVNTTMQLNSTAGFSIITWTGAGNNTSTAGHGLGAIPDCIIVKNREDTQNWSVAFPKFENSKLLGINLTSAFFSASGLSSYNSSTFVDGSGSTSEDFIAYCFKNIQGYSKFANYKGNGNADGPFVYTGFKPAWLLIKRSSSTGDWLLWDNKRDTFNVTDGVLKPNSTATENTGYWFIDFLSNGFKIRATDGEVNESGGTFNYMAFAENPFTSSEGVPTTAR